ncbi:MAG: ABC transporter substrate-binding protein [Burkholderiales bacterium]
MPEQSTTNVDLYYTRCGAATSSALAIRKQWLQAEFAKPGTVLHSLRDSHSLEVRNSHYHHKQSGMFREGGNIPPIWARGQGQDTVVLGITWLDEYQGIITREGSGIRTVADLQGKRLGVPRHQKAVIDFQRGAAQHGFENALRLAGASAADALFVDIDAPSYDTEDGPRQQTREPGHSVELEALNAGQVDAIFLRFARGYRLSKTPGYHEVININTLADPIQRVNNGTPRPITVDRAFLNKHPDVVVQLLSSDNGGPTPAEVVASHGRDVHRSFEPRLSGTYIAGLEAQKDFLFNWGYVKHNFSVARDWVVHEPLARARQLVIEQDAQAERAVAVAA